MRMDIRECTMCGCRCECFYGIARPICDECWEEQGTNSLAVINDDGSVEFND